MNLLVFNFEADFGEDIRVVANNEVDLEQFLIERGFKNIEFSDLRTSYGTCQFKSNFDNITETAKCFYVNKI